MFEKDQKFFPSKAHSNFLSHCAVSPLYGGAAAAATVFHQEMVAGGVSSLSGFLDVVPRYREGLATMMKTTPENISFAHSTAESMCQIANGYPFEPGDQIISYVNEYPSNHYPWLMQERRGAELLLLPDVGRATGFDSSPKPSGWQMDDLERLCTSRTRVVALSHVQFTSGYAADLIELGRFCRERDIDVVIDAAQSLGCLPVYPEEYGIAAVASSGWKWMMGPKGAAVLYSSSALREKLQPTMAGPGMMQQTFDYLDHSWNPFHDGRLFEYSTIPWDHVAALGVIAEDIFSRYPMEDISNEVFRLQDLFLDGLDQDFYRVQHFDEKHRSGIISIVPKRGDAVKLAKILTQKKVIVTERGGYLRVAPHFYLDDEQIVDARVVFNRVIS